MDLLYKITKLLLTVQILAFMGSIVLFIFFPNWIWISNSLKIFFDILIRIIRDLEVGAALFYSVWIMCKSVPAEKEKPINLMLTLSIINLLTYTMIYYMLHTMNL